MPGEVEPGEMVSHTARGERPVDNESVQKLEVSNIEKVQETAALWQRDIFIYFKRFLGVYMYVCTRIVQTHIDLKAVVVHFPWLRSSIMGWLGSGALRVHVAWGYFWKCLCYALNISKTKYGSRYLCRHCVMIPPVL